MGLTSIELFHQVRGSGRPIVLLHGFGATSYYWRDLVPVLSSRNEVHLIDLKGFGESPKPRDGRYSIVDQADLVLRVIAKHKLHHVTVVGHSLGAAVTIVLSEKLAQIGPDMLSSLVLMSAPTGEERGPFFARIIGVPVIGPLILWLVPTRLQVRAALKYLYHNDDRITDDQVAVYARSLSSQGGRYAFRETYKDADDESRALVKKIIQGIRVPTLLVTGRHDPLIPVASGQQLNKQIKGSKLVIIEDTGHPSLEETPAPVVKAVLEFLDR